MTDWSNPFGYTDADWAGASWPDRFTLISPYFWTFVGIGFALGTSIIGAAWY